MKKVIAVAALTALTGSAFAQLSTLPPMSTTDGVAVQPIGLNAGPTHWENPATLGAFKFASDDNFAAPDPVSLGWTIAPPGSIMSHINSIDADGGTIRAIFTGESAGWLNDFGYTYDGNPASATQSFTVFKDIQAANTGNGSVNINFGDYIDVGFLQSDSAANFDFWLNGVGEFGLNTPTPTQLGGVYTAIHPTNSTPYVAGQVLWAPSPIFVNTWVQALNGGLGGYTDVATYLVGFDDWRLDRGSDADDNDFMFALQFYRADGTPFTPIPEPSTYGLIGAVALVGLIARRRFSKKA
jgi:hypothetical protein